MAPRGRYKTQCPEERSCVESRREEEERAVDGHRSRISCVFYKSFANISRLCTREINDGHSARRKMATMCVEFLLSVVSSSPSKEVARKVCVCVCVKPILANYFCAQRTIRKKNHSFVCADIRFVSLSRLYKCVKYIYIGLRRIVLFRTSVQYLNVYSSTESGIHLSFHLYR